VIDYVPSLKSEDHESSISFAKSTGGTVSKTFCPEARFTSSAEKQSALQILQISPRTVPAEIVTTKNPSCLCQSPLRRCTIGSCKLHVETAEAHETPKHFSFDQCGQQGCNFCESSIWGSWNLPVLLAKQSHLVTSMWAGMRFKELTSSPG